MKIYIWEMPEGVPYEDSPASATLFASEAEAVQDIRDYMGERSETMGDVGNDVPLPPDGLDAQAIIEWGKEQPEWEDEAREWKFSVWDTDKTSSIVVAGW